jgi:hypothetical protein
MGGERTRAARRKATRRGVTAVLALAFALALATVAPAARSLSDTAQDNNAAPDVTAVALTESPNAILTASVVVSNYQALPQDSWFNLWFDLDNNPRTGADGDEALVRYFDDGGIRFYRWAGGELARRPATGMFGSFTAGTLALSVPRAALDTAASFGMFVVGVRAQADGEGGELLAGDFAPNSGNARYVSPAPLAITDAAGDQEAAPDITDVDIRDTKAGRIEFRVATPSHARLPASAWIELDFDVDRLRGTGSFGVEAFVDLDNRGVNAGRWSTDERKFIRIRKSGVTARSAGGVVTFSVPRRFLHDVARFDFYAISGYSTGDDDNAIDLAPNGDAWWKYTLANKAPLSLRTGTPKAIPARPSAGRGFTVAVPVLRSDTARGITSGSAACKLRVAGRNFSVAGNVSAGFARCSLALPEAASGTVVRGSMTVRSSGKSTTAGFAFLVRR